MCLCYYICIYESNVAVYLLIYAHEFSIIHYSNYFCWKKILIPAEPLYSVKSSLGIVTKYTQMTPSSFWVPRNLSHLMIRQARTGYTVLVGVERWQVGPKPLPWWLGGGRMGKDDRKQKKISPGCSFNLVFLLSASTCDTERRKSKREQ